MNSHTATWVLLKLFLQQTQPVINKLTGGRGTIIKRPILNEKQNSYSTFLKCILSVNVMCVGLVCTHHHINAVFLQRRFIIGDITDSNNCGGTVMLQVLKGTTLVVKKSLKFSVHLVCTWGLYIWQYTHISYLYEGAERAVCGVVCDKKSHVLVAQFHWSRTIHGGQCHRMISDLYMWAVSC